MPSLQSKTQKKSSFGKQVFSRKKTPAEPAQKMESTKSRSRGRQRIAPGDRQFTLSLNTVLVIALIVAMLSLGTYYLGFKTGKSALQGEGPELALKGQSSRGADWIQHDSDKGIPSANYPEDAGGSDRTGFSGGYGIQVGTWDASKEAIAREANQWLKKKGYDSKLYPLANRNEFIIMIGSFADKKDPVLLELLQTVRSVDDYPYGASSPFKDARIKFFQVSKNR